MSKYINPYTDFGFKKLFGEEANKDLLIDFLNEILPEKHQIAELTFKNTEQLQDLPEQRKAFFDIHCVSKGGEQFIVEMQKAKVNYFKDRSLFYTTFPIRDQAQRGDWDFRLADVYFIAILDFEYDEEEDRRKLLRHVQLRDQDGELFYHKLHFKFIQMPLFVKEEHELVTHFDKWLYFLKKLSTFDEIPAMLKEPIFERAFTTAALASLSQDQRNEYEKSKLVYWENNAVITSAEDRGEKRGIEIGLEQGREELEKTKDELEKAQNELDKKDLAFVTRLFKKGQSAIEIADLTGISMEKVLQFIAETSGK